MTIRELFEACFDHHWNTERYTKSGWAKEVRGYYTRHIEGPLGDRLATELGPKAVRAWHRAIDQRTSANRSLEVLSRLYTYAEEEELIPLGLNPCRHVKANTEKKRLRFATEEELRKIGEQLEAERAVYPLKVAFCELLALTGARPSSIQRARRSDIVTHGDIGLLRLDGKGTALTGDEDTVVLPAQALKIVQELPLRADGLLIGPIDYKRFWEDVTRNAGVSGLWLRDFRRSAATVGLSAGIPIGIIGELLNHRSSQTTQRYAKLLPLARVAAANSIADKMGKLLRA